MKVWFFFSRLEFTVETRCSSGVKTGGEHLQRISHNTGLISWVYQCWIGTLGSYLRDMRDMKVVPTPVSVSPQQEKEGPLIMRDMRCARFPPPPPSQSSTIFLHHFSDFQGTGQDTAAALDKKPSWSRLINWWFHFNLTRSFRLHRRSKKNNNKKHKTFQRA